MSASKSFTGDSQPEKGQTDRMSSYRGAEPGEDRLPTPFNEGVEPPPPPPEAAPAPVAADPVDPEQTPPMRKDPRAAIAARAKERRNAEQEEIRDTLGDINAPPAYASLDSAPDEAPAPAPIEPKPAAPAPAPQDERPQTYRLKVNHNEFNVGRADLARYAGVSEEIAQTVPEPTLVMLAQKNLAADMRLEEARQIEKRARSTAPDSPSHQTDDQRHVAKQLDEGTPAFDLKSTVQKIQLGDDDEAAQAFIEGVSTIAQKTAEEALAQQRFSQRVSDVRSTIEKDLKDFASANPDIASDRVLNSTFRNMIVEEALADVARIPGVPQEKIAEAMHNPARAMEIYQAAVVDGYQVRTPAEIFRTAGEEIRRTLGGARQGNPDPQSDPRTAAKRGLIQQPAHNDSSQMQPTPQPQQRRSASETIRMMARRTEGVRMTEGY